MKKLMSYYDEDVVSEPYHDALMFSILQAISDNTYTSKREKYTSKRDRERAQQSTTTIPYTQATT